MKLAIFDLDGTLLNTIADLAQSTNRALEILGFSAHPEEAYRFMVGNGINKLFERALPEEERTEENIARMRELFLPYYAQHNMDKSSPYPGVVALLHTLADNGIQLAVASNKYQAGTEALVAHYFAGIPFVAVLGQREGIAPKPDPAIVFDILKTAGVNKEDAIYIGDSGVDMQTANNSGVTACGVTWGFRPKEELDKHTPMYIVDEAAEIERIILG